MQGSFGIPIWEVTQFAFQGVGITSFVRVA
jgi:hypothetical protein